MKNIYLLIIFFYCLSANAQQPFITTWEIDQPNTAINIPIWHNSNTNYTINFGDGTILYNQNSEANHIYNVPGIYTVTISGNYNRIVLGLSDSAPKLLTIEQWGTTIWETMNYAFEGCTNLTINATDTPILSQVADMTHMFDGCIKLNQPLNNWDVSHVTNMSYMFSGATLFNQPLDSWNTGNVTNMEGMLRGTISFNQPINNWNVSTVTNMSKMFAGSTYNQPLNSWNVSSVTNMSQMFFGSIYNQSLNSWDVSNVINMKEMFKESNYNQPLDNWDTSNVANMEDMFRSTNNFNQPIGSWDVSNVITMKGMFKDAVAFNQQIATWDTSAVTTMEDMFYGARNFNQPLNDWDVSSVTNMKQMFYGPSVFNQPLNNWNTGSVINMYGMFMSNNSFNGAIGNWDVSNVTIMSHMFNNTTGFNQPVNDWNVSNVVDMSYMFQQASAFNQPLDQWDTSSVLTMEGMFGNAFAFNQPLNSWNVSAVTNMSSMFGYASAFNNPLNNWNVTGVLKMFGMFNGAAAFNQDLSSWNFNANVNFSNINISTPVTINFIQFSGLDTANYDALLLKFAQMGLQNKFLYADGLKYCNVGVRNYLDIDRGWTIYNDGLGNHCMNNIISGTVLYDYNNNGCGTSDIAVTNLMVNANNTNALYSTFGTSQGTYSLNHVSTGAYNVSLLNVPPYFSVSQTTASVGFSGFGATQIVNFCLSENQLVRDLQVTLLPLTNARPGFGALYQVVVKNVGSQNIVGAQVELLFDNSKLVYLSSTPNATTVTANKLIFSLSNLQPFESRVMTIAMDLFAPPVVNGGELLNFTATIISSGDEYSPADNTFNLVQEIVNSFDPNDKQVLQGEEINISEADNYLDYIIRFQNTGSASATTVKIIDNLSNKLDWTTLQPVSASHNYYVQMRDSNKVEFIFNNINLPGQVINDVASKGFIAYKVKPKSNVQIGDVITGQASIYFDYNLPIITNHVSTLITDNLNVNDISKLNIKIYPNPVNDILHLDFDVFDEPEEVEIFNIQGRRLIFIKDTFNNIDVTSLTSGVYFVRIKTVRGSEIRKLIKR